MNEKNHEIKIEQIDKAMEKKATDSSGVKWYSPLEQPFRLSGFPFITYDKVYRRMPVVKELKLPLYVDILANCTAGGQISFCTNSRRLLLKVELAGCADMDQMPATGQCGFDCYIGEPGKQLYCNTVRHDHSKSTYEYQMFDIIEIGMKDILLNFPLFQGVKEVFIGLESGAEVYAPLPYAVDKPVVVYGTSITQGGCASRPGMVFTNILSRRLNIPFINLGFSGNGKGEPEVARVIADIQEPLCFILDYEGNARTGGILENTLPGFVAILRGKHPDTPILVISKTKHAKESFFKAEYERLLYLRDFQAGLVKELNTKGDRNIHFCNGMELLGADYDECTVDGVHLTDLGFWRMAEKLEPILRNLVFQKD
jgi:hypothetical protein